MRTIIDVYVLHTHTPDRPNPANGWRVARARRNAVSDVRGMRSQRGAAETVFCRRRVCVCAYVSVCEECTILVKSSGHKIHADEMRTISFGCAPRIIKLDGECCRFVSVGLAN